MNGFLTARSLWDRLESDHTPYLTRAREASALTLPYLIPPEGASGATRLPTPHQSIGARGVINVSSKLLMSLFPPSVPFFSLQVDEGLLMKSIREMLENAGLVDEEQASTGQLSQAAEQMTVKIREETKQSVLSSEHRIAMEFDNKAYRSPLHAALQHLVVGGNVATFERKDGSLRMFSLPNYRCDRRPNGRVDTVIVRETMHPGQVPEELRHVSANAPKIYGGPVEHKPVTLYTCAKHLGNDKYEVWQEVEGESKASERLYPFGSKPIEWEDLPLDAIPMNQEDEGSAYGRGMVEAYQGDLESLDGLMQNILEGSANASRLLWLVNPHSQFRTRVKDLATAPNGAFRIGSAEDVTALTLDKGADFSIAWSTAQDIKSRLEQAFLLNQPREAERVTAEEIRERAAQLEDTLGGTYSNLAVRLQMPMVRRIMRRLEREGRLNEMPEGVVQPKVVAGLEALGRGHELNRMRAFAAEGAQTLGPETFAAHVNGTEWLLRVATAAGIDAAGVIKSQEEVLQERQQQNQQAIMEKGTPNAVSALGKIASSDAQGGPTQ